MSLRDLILNANDKPLTPVEVPEWGCVVYLRPLSGLQRAGLVKAVAGGAVAYGPALVAVLCDEDGSQLFGLEDIEAINNKCGMVLERLSAMVVSMNGLAPQAVEAAGN